MIKKLGFTALLLSLSYVVSAQSINKTKLDSFFNDLIDNNKAMGSVAVSKNGNIYQKAIGYSYVKGDVKTPVNIRTKYRIGSITKMFTGVLVFQLIEDKKLTLDTKLGQFYPQIPNAGSITIGQLLSHRSGLFNITSADDFGSYMNKPQTHEQMLEKIAALEPNFKPGEKMEYSNTNFILLSYIVEKITGKSYAELIKQQIVNKIGLKDTYYGAAINVANNEALPFGYTGGWNELPQTDMSIPTGAGAIVSTPTDIVKFIEALFAGKLIGKASLEQMKPSQEFYGMAMHKIVLDDKTGYGHNGSIDGFRSESAYFPEEKVAVAYTSNGGVYSSDKVLKGILSIVFNKPFVLPNFKTLTLKTEELDKYLGVYSSPDFPLKITISKNNTTLLGKAGEQNALTLTAVAKDVFEFEPADIHMEFILDKGKFILKQRGKIIEFTKE